MLNTSIFVNDERRFISISTLYIPPVKFSHAKKNQFGPEQTCVKDKELFQRLIPRWNKRELVS